MQGQETYFKNKKKQGFFMKMEGKQFAGPRNILQTKRQGFCVVFLSILKIGTTGPTTGHWTENWSFYLTKAAAAAIAGQMSQQQASREHAVSRSDVQRAVDRHRYIPARSTDLSLPCSSFGI